MRQIQLSAIAVAALIGLTGFVSYSSVVGKWSIRGAAPFGCTSAETILDFKNDGTFSAVKSVSGCNPASLADLNKDSASGKWTLLPADRSTGPLSVLKEKVLLDLDYGSDSKSTYTVTVYMKDGKNKLKLVAPEPPLYLSAREPKRPLPATLGSNFGLEYDKAN